MQNVVHDYVDEHGGSKKYKRGLLGRKEVYPLGSFSLGSDFDWPMLATTLARSELPDRPWEASRDLSPFLLNRYKRRYFLSADSRIRLTLDSEREFYPVGQRNNTFCLKFRDPGTPILELKYSPEWSERAMEIANHFPFRMTKSSKYVHGTSSAI